MQVFRNDTSKSGPAVPSRRRALAAATASLGIAAALTGCSSSPSSSTPPTSASTSKATTSSTSAAPTTTVAPKAYLSRSGKGDKSFATSSLPTKWMATWHFNCEHPTRKANFTLDAGPASGPLVRIISQTGLGGGGQRPYTSGGRYRFSVSTTCNWDVTAEAMPST